MYGIVIAYGYSGFQIVGIASTKQEAVGMMNEYIAIGQDADAVAPEHFEIHRLDANGLYTIAETL